MATEVQCAWRFGGWLRVGLLAAVCLGHVPLAQAAPTPRRDPAGVTGISPFAAALARGDTAFFGGDLAAALEAYREAVRLSPKDVKGHLRLAAALRAQTNPEGANAVLESALAVAADAEQRGRVLLQRGEAAERALDLARAQTAWQEYKALAGSAAAATTERGVPLRLEIAEARLNQIASAQQRTEEYAAVRARIDKREQELDASTRGVVQPH
jgi:tetratricopeptide (TPR) repeat protein